MRRFSKAQNRNYWQFLIIMAPIIQTAPRLWMSFNDRYKRLGRVYYNPYISSFTFLFLAYSFGFYFRRRVYTQNRCDLMNGYLFGWYFDKCMFAGEGRGFSEILTVHTGYYNMSYRLVELAYSVFFFPLFISCINSAMSFLLSPISSQTHSSK